MKSDPDMPANIYRSSEWDDLIKMFYEPDERFQTRKFSTIMDLQCFAAVLGYKFKNKKEFSRSTAKDIKLGTFSSNPQRMELIDLIALSEKRDTSILKKEKYKECFAIFEDYAHGGFEILEKWTKKEENLKDIDKNETIFREINEMLSKQATQSGNIEMSDPPKIFE